MPPLPPSSFALSLSHGSAPVLPSFLSAPFIGSTLSKPYFSVSHDDVVCEPTNIVFGGSTPPFQLGWEVFPPYSAFDGSWGTPSIQEMLGVYPTAGVAPWNATASLSEGSSVRFWARDGKGALSYDVVREVRNGRDRVDGCKAKHVISTEASFFFGVLLGIFAFVFLAGLIILYPIIWNLIAPGYWALIEQKGWLPPDFEGVCKFRLPEPIPLRILFPDLYWELQLQDQQRRRALAETSEELLDTRQEVQEVQEEAPPRYEAQDSGMVAGEV